MSADTILYLDGVSVSFDGFKALNALYLLLVFPLVTLVLLTGGHFGIGMSSFLWVAGLMLAATAALPAVFGGLEVMAARNRWGTLAILFGGLPYLAIEFFFGNPLEVLPGVAKGLLTLILLGAALSLQSTWVEGRASGIRVILGWLGVTLAILAAMAFLNIDFGLEAGTVDAGGGGDPPGPWMQYADPCPFSVNAAP